VIGNNYLELDGITMTNIRTNCAPCILVALLSFEALGQDSGPKWPDRLLGRVL
jgi:hypothetical protein